MGPFGWRLGAPAVVLAIGALSCATSSFGAMTRLVSLSEREEAQIGGEAMLELRRTRIFAADGPMLDRVRAVGQELAAVAPDSPVSLNFEVMDAGDENAFAIPGGSVIVTRGIFLLCNDVDELAGILGHEIGHLTARHAANRLGLSRPLATLAGLLRRAVGSVDEQLGDEVSARLPALLLAPYARAQEREADRTGITLAASAGFDAEALARVLMRLKGVPDEAASTSGASALFASHPSPAVRAELIRTLAAQLERSARATGTELLDALDGVTVAEGPYYGTLVGETVLLAAWGIALDLPASWLFVATERGFIGAALGGHGQVRVLVQDPEVAQGQQAQLKREPALADWNETPAGNPRRVVRATLRLGSPVSLSHYAWVYYDSLVLQVVADGSAADAAAWLPVVDRLVASVRAATTAELEGVEVLRLRLVAAARGETLAALAARTGSAWSVAEMARYNDVDPRAPLAAGRRVKIAQRERLRCDRVSSVQLPRCR